MPVTLRARRHLPTRAWLAALFLTAALLLSACSDGTALPSTSASTGLTAGSSDTSSPSEPGTATGTGEFSPAPSAIASSAPTSSTPSGTGPVHVLAVLGDSYSAGVGGPTTPQGSCGRQPAAAYGPRAAAYLTSTGVRVNSRLLACGGAVIGDLDRQLSGLRGADAAVVTIGGNDTGFTAVITACFQVGACPVLDGDKANLIGVTGTNGRSDWQQIQFELNTAYRSIVSALPRSGTLYVLTYPLPFARTTAATCELGFVTLPTQQTLLLNAYVLRLGDTISAAVRDAEGAALAAGRHKGSVILVDQRTPDGTLARSTVTVAGMKHPVAWNPRGLCATTPHPVLNGIANALENSFHPTADGYAAGAALLLQAAWPQVSTWPGAARAFPGLTSVESALQATGPTGP